MSTLGWFLLLFWFALNNQVRAQDLPPQVLNYADMVFYNGKVIAADERFTVAEAVAVRDGKILAVGKRQEIIRMAGPKTQRIDLKGKSVVPGFVDSDGDNAFAGGDFYKYTQVGNRLINKGRRIRGDDVTELRETIRQHVRMAKPGESVFLNAPKAFPVEANKWTRKDLDELAPTTPLLITLTSSDALANSVMLKQAFAAGLPKSNFGVMKDNNGEPTGQLSGQSAGFVMWNLRPYPDLQPLIEDQHEIMKEFAEVGVTTLTGHATGLDMTLWNVMAHKNELKLRFRPALDFIRQNPLGEQFFRRVGNLVDFHIGGMVKIIGAAIGPVDDGSNSPSGILTHEPRKIIPEVGGFDPRGEDKWLSSQWTDKRFEDLTPEERNQTEWLNVQLARRYGWNLSGIHNMGSRATEIILQSLDEANRQEGVLIPKLFKPNGLDHNLVWHPKSLELAQKLKDHVRFGLNAEIFDQRVSRGREVTFAQFGEKMHNMQPIQDLFAAGLAVHSEGGEPKKKPPMRRIKWLVTRTDNVGRAWGAKHAVDRKTALWMTTLYAAKFIGEEKELGSIEVGKLADLVVLGGDFLSVPDGELDKLSVLMTVV
ncbi:MAG TPA: amidohydrolase family protein, partial [Candidatus Binatia bacterium]|nr:amidohydrolase family protein [Candidatus Binatia bacterium]